jgi:hypothetical protein
MSPAATATTLTLGEGDDEIELGGGDDEADGGAGDD